MVAGAGDESAPDTSPDDIGVLIQAFAGFSELVVDPRTHADLGRRSGCGVSWVELALLRFLREGGPATTAELARASRRREPAVLRAVQTLQAHGFVVRKPDLYDRRALRIHLTPGGTIADDHRVRALRELASEVLSGWAPEDVATLSTLFSRYTRTAIARVDQVAPPGGPSPG